MISDAIKLSIGQSEDSTFDDFLSSDFGNINIDLEEKNIDKKISKKDVPKKGQLFWKKIKINNI